MRTGAKIGAALAVLLAAAASGGAWIEARCQREEREGGLLLPWDQPGRKYALAGGEGKNTLNSLGFNDREFTVAKTPGVTRVAVFGDSLTFGSGIPPASVYPAAAETILRERGQSVEIYNFSVYGYDVEQVAATLRWVGWTYAPDLVVYAYFTNDSFPSELLTLADGHTPIFVGTDISADMAVVSPAFSLFAARHSAAFRRWLGAIVTREEARRNTKSENDDSVRLEATDAAVDEDFFRRNLEAMQTDAAAHQTPFVVYGLVPHVLANRDLGRCGQPNHPASFCLGQILSLHDTWQMSFDLGIPFVSSLPWLQSEGRESYFGVNTPQDDIHAGAEGHHVLALGLSDLVTRAMAGESLLSPPDALPEEVSQLGMRRHGVGKPKHPGGGKRRREAEAAAGGGDAGSGAGR